MRRNAIFSVWEGNFVSARLQQLVHLKKKEEEEKRKAAWPNF